MCVLKSLQYDISKVFWEEWIKRSLVLALILTFCLEKKKKTPILLHVHRYEMILYSNTERDLKFCREAAALVKPLRESDCFGRGSCQQLTSLTCAAAVPYVSPALKSLRTLWSYQNQPRGMEVRAPRDWNTRSKATAKPGWRLIIAGRAELLLSALTSCLYQQWPWAAYPEGPRSFSDQNRVTCNLTFPEAQAFAHHQTQCLFHFFLTCPCSDSLRTPHVCQP